MPDAVPTGDGIWDRHDTVGVYAAVNVDHQGLPVNSSMTFSIIGLRPSPAEALPVRTGRSSTRSVMKPTTGGSGGSPG